LFLEVRLSNTSKKIEIVMVKVVGGATMALMAEVAEMRGYKEGDWVGPKEALDAVAQNAAYLMNIIRQMDKEANQQ